MKGKCWVTRNYATSPLNSNVYRGTLYEYSKLKYIYKLENKILISQFVLKLKFSLNLKSSITIDEPLFAIK